MNIYTYFKYNEKAADKLGNCLIKGTILNVTT